MMTLPDPLQPQASTSQGPLASILNSRAGRRSRRAVLQFALGLGLVGAIAACGGGAPDTGTSPAPTEKAGQKVELTLVSYAVTQAAYEQIIPKFAAQWKEKTGQEVEFNQSYGGSGSQTRAILDGLEADVAALALAGDTKKLQEGGLIEPGWEQEAPNDAIVHRSVAALVLREGNPKNVKGWDDLARGDVSVVTANPKTSGGAKWNFLAAWGYKTQAGKSEAEALDFVTLVWTNCYPALPNWIA